MKTSILFYGKSGVGKSTQARYIAEYVYARFGKKTRYVGLDTGSLFAPIESLIAKGIVEPLLVPTAPEFNPMATMRKIRRGEWPKDGTIQPSVKVKDGYKNPNIWTPWGEHESAEIGAYFVDSLSEYANALMYDSRAKNIRYGSEGSQPRVEDGEQIGTNTMLHYGEAQGEVCAAMTSFLMLPIEIVGFTALEDSGTDDDGGVSRTALGPKLVGKKAITMIPARVLNNFHLVSEGSGRQRTIKAWYEDHPSELPKLNWPAKVGLEVNELPKFWKAYPSGFIPLTLEKGIRDFLEFRENSKNGIP